MMGYNMEKTKTLTKTMECVMSGGCMKKDMKKAWLIIVEK